MCASGPCNPARRQDACFVPAVAYGLRQHAILPCFVDLAHHLVEVGAQVFKQLVSGLRLLSFSNDPLHKLPVIVRLGACNDALLKRLRIARGVCWQEVQLEI
jgi:hypothetical protein